MADSGLGGMPSRAWSSSTLLEGLALTMRHEMDASARLLHHALPDDPNELEAELKASCWFFQLHI